MTELDAVMALVRNTAVCMEYDDGWPAPNSPIQESIQTAAVAVLNALNLNEREWPRPTGDIGPGDFVGASGQPLAREVKRS